MPNTDRLKDDRWFWLGYEHGVNNRAPVKYEVAAYTSGYEHGKLEHARLQSLGHTVYARGKV